jgi:hypothetical protein
MGFARQGGVRVTHQREGKRERGGVRYRNESENSRADKRAGERGHTVQWRGECGAMLRPREHDSRGPRHRRLPQDTQRPRPGKCSTVSGHRGNVPSVFQLLQITGGYAFFVAVLPLFLLNPTCTSLSYTLRSEHTCFFQTPLTRSQTWEHYSINPPWISR